MQAEPLSGVVGRHTSHQITQEQTEAILASHPITVIIGCPGSGKSAILCSHMKQMTTPFHQLPAKIKHAQIIAVAFTQKAAHEIILRMHQTDPGAGWNQIDGENDGKPFIGTHHKLLLKILTEFKTKAGYPQNCTRIRFLNDAEKEELTKQYKGDIIRAHTRNLSADWETTETETTSLLDRRAKERGFTYNERLLLDVQKLLADPEVLDTLQKRKYHLLVDEAQDMGPDITKIYMAFPAAQKYIVGDAAQSIYTFRDDGESLLAAMSRAPGAHIIELTHNFRSFPYICLAANQLINNHKPDLDQKPMVAINLPSNPIAPTVIQWECETESHELEQMILITKYYAEVITNHFIYSNIGIICQNAAQERLILQSFEKHRIPVILDRNNADAAHNEGNGVHIARIHQCKGLEYANAIIPFCTAGNWPGRTEPNLARRQMYVAMTRARSTVHFIYHCATERDLFERTGRPISNYENRVVAKKSPFLDEMNTPKYTVEIRTVQRQKA